MSEIEWIEGNSIEIVDLITNESVDLVYIDPPFNTGKTQSLARTKDYKEFVGIERSYEDSFDDYWGWMFPLLKDIHRILKAEGSLFLHLDWREAHYAKVYLDIIFGRGNFQNEIIWAYDYGGRSKKKWSSKHDTIFWYSKHPKKYTFNFDEMDRIPYMAPGLVGPEKAARGKTPTDVWWHTIVPTNGKERTGYPTQKPLGVLKRIINVHTNPGDLVVDLFAGSGTTGEACKILDRNCILVDCNPEAIEVIKERINK